MGEAVQAALQAHRAGRLDEAASLCRRALEAHPDSFEALQLMGVLESQRGRLQEALDLLRRALAIRPDSAATLANLGIALARLGRAGEAEAELERALSLAPASAPILFNLANLLAESGRHEQALARYDEALQAQPDFVQALNNRADVLMRLDRTSEALQSYQRALVLHPGYAEGWSNAGKVLRELGRHEDAALAYDRALALDPQLDFLPGARLHSRMKVCLWSDFEEQMQDLAGGLEAGRPVSTPFAVLATPLSADQQLRCARLYVALRYPHPSKRGVAARQARTGKIRLGYFSADLRDHAVAHLIVEVLERHDRSRFEVVGFSLKAAPGDAMRERIERACDEIVELAALPDGEAAETARRRQVDIAIDLNGFTLHGRPGIFAAGVAPLQVNYLGYPGTLGASFIDYIVADPVIIPEACFTSHSERVVQLPHSYQANQSFVPPAGEPPGRAELGLPERGVVFCCFNNSYKITPDVYTIWMRLLAQVPDSVLWLFETNPGTRASLRREAGDRGIEEGRIVFADRVPRPQHLLRQACADLFLDTFHYNAHTTASDALRAGLPVLTLLGQTFASRVGASLLHAIGMPELVASSSGDYETMALELARDSRRLAEFKARLARNRSTHPLFDCERFTRHLETAYARMWGRHVEGLPPAPITVTPDASEADRNMAE
jgi:predicted O-linked N-acetylglucosamine transferase (SPINDLY family)